MSGQQAAVGMVNASRNSTDTAIPCDTLNLERKKGHEKRPQGWLFEMYALACSETDDTAAFASHSALVAKQNGKPGTAQESC